MSARSPHEVIETLEQHAIDVVLLGFPKAGTTHLARWLDASAGCEVSDPKETFLLCPEFGRRVSRRTPFSGHPDLLRIEATTLNVYSPVVRAALEQDERRRAILLVREPWQCAVSWHNQVRLAGLGGDRPLIDLWAASTGTSSPDEHLITDYRQLFDFGTHLADWRASIGDERLLVISNAELGTEARPTIEQFLDIELGPEPQGRANALHEPRLPGAYAKLRNTSWIRHLVERSGPLRRISAPIASGAKSLLTRSANKAEAPDEIREALTATWQDALVEADENRRYWRSR